MEKIVLYEKLNDEIKSEIEKYHESKVKKGFARDISSSSAEWFDKYFEPWLIEHKLSSEGENLRKSVRVDIELPLTVAETLIENDVEDQSDLNLIAKVVNISRGGIYFKSGKPFPESSIIRVQIDLSNVDAVMTEIEALAMVTRCESLDDGNYGIGVVFSSIYNEQKENLNIFIFKQLAFYIQQESDATEKE